MSADDPKDPNVAALRAAGHDDAADLLERVARERDREEATKVRPAPVGIRLLDAEPPIEAQRRREGEVLLAGMRAAGVAGDAGWISGGGLMGGNR